MAVDDFVHWQLRHYISLPEPDHLYYATGSDVWCLNPSTQKRNHIAYLPFEARCTASGHGWLCVGGEDNGDFAAIKTGSSQSADVDTALPLDFGNSENPHSSLSAIAPRVRIERIGDEIVNSVSVHRLPSLWDGASDEVVAVLTNNDKSVRIYSLTHLAETARLLLPFPVNHATISPDGQILVAVGDAPRAYFYERMKGKKGAKLKSNDGSSDLSSDWQLLREVRLHSPREATNCCYFSTAWSPSGTLCAIGSECGYINIFETALLEEMEFGEDAIVRILASSRPKPEAGPGAIRTMMFAPETWDLLIWSEDSGRVCIGDLRTGLRTKQTIHLDHQEEGLEKLEVIDADDPTHIEYSMLSQEADFIRRYRRALDADDTRAAVGLANEYISASQSRRDRMRQTGLDEDYDDDPHGLTNQERAILEALRTTRQREEARNNGTLPRSINYPSASMFDRNRGSSHGGADFPALRASRTTSTAEQSMHLGSLREYLRNRDINPDRPPWQPRRRSSIILSETNTSNDGASNNPTTSRTSLTSPAPETSSSLSTYNPTPSSSSSMLDSWRTIEASMQRERERDREVRDSPSSVSRPTYSPSNLWDIARDTQNQTSQPSDISNELSRLRRIRESLAIEREANRPLTAERFLQLRQEIQDASIPRSSSSNSSTPNNANNTTSDLPSNNTGNPSTSTSSSSLRRSPARNLVLTSATSSSHLPTAADASSTTAHPTPRDGASTPPPPAPLDPSHEIRRLRALVRTRERAARLHQTSTTNSTSTTAGAATTANTAAAGDRGGGGTVRAVPFGSSTAINAAGLIASERMGLVGRISPEWGVRTAGLAMSADGRRLYVGSEEGVWEVRIDVAGRRFCPSVEVR
ncbi:MAG: hypothetical protein Q9165_005276 [Trypethelium subeluteriae]